MPALKLPYWMHQLIEYLVGFLVLFECARIAEPLVPTLTGAGVVILGSLGDAPLSAFRSVPRPVHRLADVGVALVALVLAVVGPVTTGGRVAMVLAVVVLAVLAWRTDFTPKRPRTPLRDRVPDSKVVGRVAGRAAGKAAVAGRSMWRNRKR